MENGNSSIQFNSDCSEERWPIIFLLDTSDAMKGERIEELNNGLKTLKEFLIDDEMARSRVDLAIITFDSEVKIVCDFVSPNDFKLPVLTAQGKRFMGTAIIEALDRIKERREKYLEIGKPYYRPWLFLITSGHPEGEGHEVLEKAMEKLQKAQDRKAVQVYAVGIGDQLDIDVIGSITGTIAMRSKVVNVKDLFVGLSKSMAAVSSSIADETIQLPVPGWTDVDV